MRPIHTLHITSRHIARCLLARVACGRTKSVFAAISVLPVLSTGQLHRDVGSPVLGGGSAEAHSTMAREWETEEESGTGAFKPLSAPSEPMLASGDGLLLDQPARHMNVKRYDTDGTSHGTS